MVESAVERREEGRNERQLAILVNAFLDLLHVDFGSAEGDVGWDDREK